MPSYVCCSNGDFTASTVPTASNDTWRRVETHFDYDNGVTYTNSIYIDSTNSSLNMTYDGTSSTNVSGVSYYYPPQAVYSDECVIYSGNTHDGSTLVFDTNSSDASFIYDPSMFKETEEQKKKRLKLEKKRRKANARARKLLRMVLGAKRFKEWERDGYIDVKAPSGVQYRISAGRMIRVFGNGADRDHSLCVVSPTIPDIDLLVQEYLMLSTQEGEARIKKIGIRHAA